MFFFAFGSEQENPHINVRRSSEGMIRFIRCHGDFGTGFGIGKGIVMVVERYAEEVSEIGKTV